MIMSPFDPNVAVCSFFSSRTSSRSVLCTDEQNERYVDRNFNAEHRVLRWFWEWAQGLEEDSRRRLLLFWSGSSRVPPFGFEDDVLNEDHRWSIEKGPAEDRCPHASTWYVSVFDTGKTVNVNDFNRASNL